MSIAAGFQSGIALGRAFNEGRERRRLEGIRTAAPEMSQGYTAEQGQQLEAMASAINPETGRPYYNVQVGQGGNYTVTPDFTEAQTPMAMGPDSQYGVAPVELQTTGLGRAGVAAQPIPFNQQRVTDFLGRRFEGELTPDRIEAMRSRAMAEGLSDPRQRQAALAEATRAEREAEEAPLRQEALRTQVEAGKLGLKKVGFELTAAERTAADAQKMDDFSAWRSQNPQADFAAMSAKAQELGMSTDAQFKIASNLTGIKEQEFKASQQRIQELVKDQGLDGLLKAHKESKDLDPNSHFEVTRGQGGRITLNRVNTATGEIIQPNVFSGSEAETTAYLNKQATNPAAVIDFTMNLEKNKAAIEESRAGTKLKTAQAANVGQDKLSPLEKNLAALKRLGVSVTPEEVKSMAGLKAPALSPEAAAQIEIITASLKDNSTPANIEAARTAVADIFRGEGLKQRNTTIVNGLRTAAGRNDLPSAVKQLQDAGVANETIVGLARQAGVPIPAELLPPAPPPQTGLNTGAPRQPIQLLAPFNAIGDLRRRMQQEQQAIDESRGF
jgi:hypothetical protein